AALISMRYGAKGPNYCTVSACASSAHALADAVQLIRNDAADVIIAGGAEAAITPLAVASFANMKALSERNDDPPTASRPFDKDRDGFVMGDGAAVMILEEWEHARRRGSRRRCARWSCRRGSSPRPSTSSPPTRPATSTPPPTRRCSGP